MAAAVRPTLRRFNDDTPRHSPADKYAADDPERQDSTSALAQLKRTNTARTEQLERLTRTDSWSPKAPEWAGKHAQTQPVMKPAPKTAPTSPQAAPPSPQAAPKDQTLSNVAKQKNGHLKISLAKIVEACTPGKTVRLQFGIADNGDVAMECSMLDTAIDEQQQEVAQPVHEPMQKPVRQTVHTPGEEPLIAKESLKADHANHHTLTQASKGERSVCKNVMVCFLVFIVAIPAVVLGVSFMFGAILAHIEEWSTKTGFYYVIGNIVGLGNPLVSVEPTSRAGELLDVLIAVWSLSLCGLAIGFISNLRVIQMAADGLDDVFQNGNCRRAHNKIVPSESLTDVPSYLEAVTSGETITEEPQKLDPIPGDPHPELHN